LRGRAPLELKRLCFCRLIDGFGMYEPLPPDHAFQAGEGVQVYVEVRNFLSTCIDSSRGPAYQINLATTLEILDFRREVVVHHDFPVVDLSLTPRQDFFINYPFPIPRQIPAGSYTLRVTVRDGNVSAGGVARMARQTYDFRVVAH